MKQKQTKDKDLFVFLMQEWFPSQIVQKRQKRGQVGKTIFRLTRESVSSSPRFSRLLHPQPEWAFGR